jgi:small subunit ribosomal protein S20
MEKRSNSAEKRHRQSEAQRLAHKPVKTAVRSAVRKFVETSAEKDAAASETALRALIKKLDSAARKGIVKKNTAARKKSRMQKRYNAIFGVSKAAAK